MIFAAVVYVLVDWAAPALGTVITKSGLGFFHIQIVERSLVFGYVLVSCCRDASTRIRDTADTTVAFLLLDE